MNTKDTGRNAGVRYEPDEKPPVLLSLGLGLQLAVLCVAGVVLTPAIVIRAAGGTEAFLSWAVFAAVAVSGISTLTQAVRFGRIGAGYVLLMGTSGAFIAVCITAIAEGGPAMLATLVVASSLFQFALAARLSLFRRILTPAVAGTVIMLIPVTVMPLIFNMLNDVPEGTPLSASGSSALVTLVVIAGLALKARGALRLWAPVVGVAAGSVVAGIFGIYNTSLIAEAAWIGLPSGGWPGLDLSFGPPFWTLLPAFMFVTLVGAIETIGGRGRHPARLPPADPGHRFSGRAGCSGGRWNGKSAIRPGRHRTQHHLFDQHIGDRAHRGRGATGRHGSGRRVHRDGVSTQDAGRAAGDSRGRWPPPTSRF